ncbi:hypothetical protein BKA67DRAFT_694262 [Truncatella angustata]|uniref:Uncharacterized protein n=1 Tax=Truncatella angustata TaxID=152316 RepID=A0A9P8UFP6_9PEZI|nr:uncharacterized protein BKA67DRAFT_694262 [Truncatella angustata]KAH6649030.1 hypothetical protein BKA67DRAFT_694262 [Truncatella angustata]KAH8201780.1 hypothetical protein TruAng_004044 [Truncatella angustata]
MASSTDNLTRGMSVMTVATVPSSLATPGFFTLPRELRDEIYFLHLDEKKSRDISCFWYDGVFDQEDPEDPYIPSRWSQSPLFLVNKQMREEVIPLFFQRCQFRVTATSNVRDWVKYRRAISQGRMSLLERHIRVQRLSMESAYSGLASISPGLAEWLELPDIRPHAFFKILLFAEQLCSNERIRAWTPDVGRVYINTRGEQFKYHLFRPGAGVAELEEDDAIHYGVQHGLILAAQEIVEKRDDFKGFSIEDIEALARRLRVEQ